MVYVPAIINLLWLHAVLMKAIVSSCLCHAPAPNYLANVCVPPKDGLHVKSSIAYRIGMQEATTMCIVDATIELVSSLME